MDTGFARLQKYDTRFRLVPFATCTSCFSETPRCIPDLSVHPWHQHYVAKGAVSDLIALHLNLSLFSYCQIRQEWSETETEKAFLLFNNSWWLFAMNLACVVFSFFFAAQLLWRVCTQWVTQDEKERSWKQNIVWFIITKGTSEQGQKTKQKQKPTMDEEMHNGTSFATHDDGMSWSCTISVVYNLFLIR